MSIKDIVRFTLGAILVSRESLLVLLAKEMDLKIAQASHCITIMANHTFDFPELHLPSLSSSIISQKPPIHIKSVPYLLCLELSQQFGGIS